MNHDEFESRLQRTPLKQPPAEWRERILAAADAHRRTAPVRELTFAATWRMRLRELFWPHPAAWGAMAAIWLVVGAVQLALHEPRPSASPVQVTGSAEAPTLLNLQNQWLLALHEPLDKPKPPPALALPPQSAIERSRETQEA